MLKVKRTHQKIGWIMFTAYLILLMYFMFFSDGFGRSAHDGYSYNLTLFREIRRFYTYRETLGTWAFLLNTAGNVLCFVPFGFFLPVISKIGEKWYGTLLASFVMTFFIEVLQLTLRVGSFDVDDMFLNTLGGMIGYICYCLAGSQFRSYRRRKRELKNNGTNERQ